MTATLTSRDDLRAQITAAEAAQGRIDQMMRRLNELDSAPERAADHHAEICGPIQAALSVIREQIADAQLLEGGDVGAGVLDRQRDLQSQLSAANAELEQAIADARREISDLQLEVTAAIRDKPNDRAPREQLIAGASEETRAAIFVAESAARWHGQRGAEARRKLQYGVTGFWEAEIAAASAAQAASLAEKNRLLEAAIAE